MVVGLEWLQLAVVACLLTLLIIYELNNTFKYYTKFLLFDGLVMLIGGPVSFYSMFRPRCPENSNSKCTTEMETKFIYGNV
jgi:hypothetical protein